MQVLRNRIWTFEQQQALALSNVTTNIRMTIIRLKDGGLWVHAPIAPTEQVPSPLFSFLQPEYCCEACSNYQNESIIMFVKIPPLNPVLGQHAILLTVTTVAILLTVTAVAILLTVTTAAFHFHFPSDPVCFVNAELLIWLSPFLQGVRKACRGVRRRSPIYSSPDICIRA